MQNVCKTSLSTHALKSPRSIIFSDLVESASKTFSYVTFVGVIRTVNKPFLSMQVNLNERSFCRRNIMAWQFGWDIIIPLKHNSSNISITIKSKWWMKTFNENWPLGKLTSIFVSDTVTISLEPLICSLRISNLFLRELASRCPNINFLIVLIGIFLRGFLTSDCRTVESSILFLKNVFFGSKI